MAVAAAEARAVRWLRVAFGEVGIWEVVVVVIGLGFARFFGLARAALGCAFSLSAAARKSSLSIGVRVGGWWRCRWIEHTSSA